MTTENKESQENFFIDESEPDLTHTSEVNQPVVQEHKALSQEQKIEFIISNTTQRISKERVESCMRRKKTTPIYTKNYHLFDVDFSVCSIDPKKFLILPVKNKA